MDTEMDGGRLSVVWDIRLAQQHLILSNDCCAFSTLSICKVKYNHIMLLANSLPGEPALHLYKSP